PDALLRLRLGGGEPTLRLVRQLAAPRARAAQEALEARQPGGYGTSACFVLRAVPRVRRLPASGVVEATVTRTPGIGRGGRDEAARWVQEREAVHRFLVADDLIVLGPHDEHRDGDAGLVEGGGPAGNQGDPGVEARLELHGPQGGVAAEGEAGHAEPLRVD